MGTENADADEAILDMLQRYEVLTMDDLIITQPNFSWAQLFARRRPAEPKESTCALSNRLELSNPPDEPSVDPRSEPTS